MNGKTHLIVAVALLIAPLAMSATQSAQGAGLLIADGGFGGVLEIKEHSVSVTVNNGIAVTNVEQVFTNTENRQVEALYTFPVPKGASVANFSMWIGGKEMIGEVVEKERAREIYNSYKQTRRDPGLLEQTDYKTFEMRIFPIAAHAEQRVQISYYQEIDVDHDRANYVYPLATVTRNQIDQRTTGRFSLRMQVRSEVPLVAMDSPSHGERFVIAQHNDTYHEASLETQVGDLSRDVVLSYQLSRPRTGIDMITSMPDGEDGYFQLTFTAGDELSALDEPMDYVFVLDISGSMGHDGKLRISKISIDAFINELGSNDRFEVICFNVQPNLLSGSLIAADESAKQRAAEFLRTQQARGGTSLAPAITSAYKYGEPDRPLNIVVLSDEMNDAGERAELHQLIRQRPANARVFCIGVGNEVNRSLLSQLAEEAGGQAAFVSRGDDFERQAMAFRRKLTRPVATDLTINFEGADVYDLVPARLPNLYHGSPIRMYGRYRRGGSTEVHVSADVLGKPFAKSLQFELPKSDGGNTEIERMWAWHQVNHLLKQADRTGSRNSAVNQVVQLGEGYSIATEYTSFIVLENDAEYRRWKIDRRNQSRIARDRRQQGKLADTLTRLRRQSIDQLGPVQAADPQPVKQQPTQRLVRNNPVQRQAQDTGRSRGWDIDLPSAGGGAFDGFTVVLALGLGGAAVLRHTRSRRGGKA